MGIDVVQEMRSRRDEILAEIERIDAARVVLQGRLGDIDFALSVVEREVPAPSEAVSISDAGQPSAKPSLGATGSMKVLWQEVLDKLPEMLVSHPRGVSAKDMADALCADLLDVRAAMERLVAEGSAVYAVRSGTKRAKLLVPVGHVGPPPDLSPLQNEVLDALRKLTVEGGVVTTQRSEFCRSLDRMQASVDLTIRALEAKGFLAVRASDTKISGRLCYDLVIKDEAIKE